MIRKHWLKNKPRPEREYITNKLIKDYPDLGQRLIQKHLSYNRTYIVVEYNSEEIAGAMHEIGIIHEANLIEYNNGEIPADYYSPEELHDKFNFIETPSDELHNISERPGRYYINNNSIEFRLANIHLIRGQVYFGLEETQGITGTEVLMHDFHDGSWVESMRLRPTGEEVRLSGYDNNININVATGDMDITGQLQVTTETDARLDGLWGRSNSHIPGSFQVLNGHYQIRTPEGHTFYGPIPTAVDGEGLVRLTDSAGRIYYVNHRGELRVENEQYVNQRGYLPDRRPQ